jgi:chromosome segregation ATPase
LTLKDVQQLIVADEKQISQLQSIIRSLEKEKYEANDKTETVTIERDSHSRNLEFSRKEADEFRRKLDSSEALVATLTNQNEKAQAKLQCMEDEYDKLTRCISQLSAKRKEESERLLQRCKRQQEASQCEIACLENIIASLKKEYEGFKVETTASTNAQIKSLETKLQSIPLLQKEISHLRGELESNTKKLHAAQEEGILLDEAQNERAILEQQVRILSSEVMKYKLQNRGMLQALDDLTIGMMNSSGK